MKRLNATWIFLILVLYGGAGCASNPSANIPPTQTPAVLLPFPSIPLTGPATRTTPTAMSPSTNTATALAPYPSPTLTASPLPNATLQPTANGGPQIVSFAVVPTATNGIGQNVLLTWQASGERAEICGVVGAGPTDCQTVPLAGQKNFVTNEASALYAQMGLRVTAGQSSVWSFVGVRFCKDSTKFFFDNSGGRCPEGPALVSRGAAQYFEHGFMIWIQATDTSYAFYRNGGQSFEFWTGPLHLKPGASLDNRVGNAPPGLYEPVSGFGLIWRGEVENSAQVSARLGWATAPEVGYDAAYQCEVPLMVHLWTCYMRDQRGNVLRLRPDSTAQVNFLWDEF